MRIYRRISAVLFVGYAAIWTALLVVPDVSRILFIPSTLPGEIAQSQLPADKLVHAFGYFLFTALANAAFGGVNGLIGLPWLAFGVMLHGAATEVAQRFIPNRAGDISDWLADAAGVAAAILLIFAFRRSLISAPRLAEREPLHR
jgi:VanZ family protein